MGKKFFILLGASGSGKSLLGSYLKELGIPELVSHTTRQPRENEVNGIHYHFVSEEEFFRTELAERGNAYPSRNGMNWYGISKKEIESKFTKYDKVFAIAEINGVKDFKEAYPNEVVVIFVYLPLEMLAERMRLRNDSEEEIQVRLQKAIESKELENGYIADYIIENYDLEESKAKLRKIVGLE